MTHPDHLAVMRLLEAAFASAGREIIPMSLVGRPASPARFHRSITADGHAICGLDVTLDIHGHWRIIEVNGSNQGLSSLGDPEGDRGRADHQVEAARHRILATERGAVLVAYAKDTLIVSEIMSRSLMVHELVSQRCECQLGDADFDPTAPYIVAVDTVERIARHMAMEDGRLHYRGRPVVSIGNVNILAELVRNGVIKRRGAGYAAEYDVFHDGPLATLIHDKGAQQQIANGTSFEPMRWQTCTSSDEVVRSVETFLHNGVPVVIKPNATSGGAGIEFFGPGCTEADIRTTLDRLLASVRTKYGPNAEKSVWPVRTFEFVQSTPYPVDGVGHLWDMRICCLIRPGEVEMTVSGLRICPEPFVSGQYTRATACSNTTGRDPSIKRFRSPLAEAGKPTAFMRAAGVDDAMFECMLDGCAAWCEAAWLYSVTEPCHGDSSGKIGGAAKQIFAR